MRTKVIYDRDRLIKLREYAMEPFASLDQALLAAADVPSIIVTDRGGETCPRAHLVIRAEHLEAAREALDHAGASVDSEAHDEA